MLVLECDENGHRDRNQYHEREREPKIVSARYTIIRYDVNDKIFQLHHVLNMVHQFIANRLDKYKVYHVEFTPTHVTVHVFMSLLPDEQTLLIHSSSSLISTDNRKMEDRFFGVDVYKMFCIEYLENTDNTTAKLALKQITDKFEEFLLCKSITSRKPFKTSSGNTMLVFNTEIKNAIHQFTSGISQKKICVDGYNGYVGFSRLQFKQRT